MLMLEKVYLKSCICVMKLKFYEEFVKILPEHLSRCLSAQGKAETQHRKLMVMFKPDVWLLRQSLHPVTCGIF